MKASIVVNNRNYMHRFKTIALCILLMLSCAPLFSKSKSKVDLRYAFGSTIDLQCGYSVMPYSVAGEARNAYGASSGSVFQMRYTYFFGRHFGAFASYSFDQGSAPCENYFGIVNRADGRLYKYEESYYQNPMRYFANSFFVGVAYRYDFGRWSLRPRVGIGVTNFDMSAFCYSTYSRQDETPVSYHSYSIISDRKDYMKSGSSVPDLNCLAGYAGVQMTYSPVSHFFLSFEVSAKCFDNRKLDFQHTVKQYKPAYNPSNWSEALVYYDLRDSVIPDDSSAKTVSSRLPYAIFNASVGIGWNLGWNRNVSRHKHR